MHLKIEIHLVLQIIIDKSVNAAFKGNKLNAAKSYFDITDC